MSEDTDNWILRNAHLFNVEDKDLLHAWDQLRRMIFDYCHDNHNEQESFMDVSGKQILKKDKDYNAYKTEAELLPKSDSITDTARQKFSGLMHNAHLELFKFLIKFRAIIILIEMRKKTDWFQLLIGILAFCFPEGILPKMTGT